MIFPEILDRVCMVSKTENGVAMILLDPNGATGSVVFTLEDLKTLIERFKAVSPEICEWISLQGKKS